MGVREDQERYRTRNRELLKTRARLRYHATKNETAWRRKESNRRQWLKNRETMLQNFHARYDKHKMSIFNEHRKDPRSRMLSSARVRAKKRGLDFLITIDDVHVPLFCPVLGVRLVVGSGGSAPSLDRIDNNKGYVPDNVWVISDRANRIKRDATLEELQLLVSKLSSGPRKFPWELRT